MLNETAKQFLAYMDAGPRLQDMGVQESRDAFADLCANIGPRGSETVAVTDVDIDGPGGDLHLRVYTPETPNPSAGSAGRPVLFYIHGGGFEMGSVDAYDGWCRFLAHASGYLTVSVDYRLIPENPFPAAVDDTRAVLRWIREHIDHHGGDPATIVVGGDSAGGSLAASLSVRPVADPKDRLAGQMLIYPCTDWSDEWPSMEEVSHGQMFLTRSTFRWTRGRYLTEGGDPFDPSASPLRAMDHSGNPPAIVITAEYDPLRDQGEAYGMKLVEAGVPVAMRRYRSTIHGFVHIAEMVPAGYEALQECASWLIRLASDRSSVTSA